MKFSVVGRHVPEAEGTATGHALRGLCLGLIAEGHEVDLWSWRPEPPDEELPSWCTWRPVPPEAWWRVRARALVRPRHDIVIAGWRPAEGAWPLADDAASFPAVRPFAGNSYLQHFLTQLDMAALRRFRPKDVQDLRFERSIPRQADAVFALSERVAAALPVPATAVPIAYPVPGGDDVVAPVDEPVAALLADWRWAPNHLALRWLLEAWPEVRRRVPAARLLLAGRFFDPRLTGGDGVEVLGPVAHTLDVLSQAAVLAFPCPATSGPKVKVLEAAAYGLPVVTTPAGAEGLIGIEAGTVVASRAGFAAALADVLADPARRAELGRGGRAAMLAHHAPAPAARARVAALSAALGLAPG